MDLMMEDQDSEVGDGRRPSTASVDSLLEPRSPHIDPVSTLVLNVTLNCYRWPQILGQIMLAVRYGLCFSVMLQCIVSCVVSFDVTLSKSSMMCRGKWT